MAGTDFVYVFTCIAPFRSMLLSMLAPFDISKLRDAFQCTITPWEQEKYMDLLDDVFEDSSIIHKIVRLGMTVRIFGADLEAMETRLSHPLGALKSCADGRIFQIFVLVADDRGPSGRSSRLVRDYRPESERDDIPSDMTPAQLASVLGTSTADEIISLSRWILCVPYLCGSLPSKPGWLPIFNSRPDVNVRAYVTNFADSDDHIIHMERPLMCKLFGYNDSRALLLHLPSLSTLCMKLEEGGRHIEHLSGKLTMNVLHNVFAASDRSREAESRNFVVVHAAYPTNSSITLSL
ncbi:hypothetical protein IQ06DRAFT_299842 [Phaeosphaeriaceae sp. SRC1lsM3a]|nr:hypothetical protein IQ06DRAFT_299842 [Stagonospora sp. SRC1lsM3a]